jgi:hypothetical protein
MRKINGNVIASIIIVAVLVASTALYLVVEKPIDEIRQRLAGAGSPAKDRYAAGIRLNET